MSRLPILVSRLLLLLVMLDGSGAHAGVRQGTAGNPRSSRANTWSARSTTGLTLAGTWTAITNETGAVAGTWTLLDAHGRTAASGGWSASKSPAGWTGNWRAAASGGRAEYADTWSAGVDFKADAPLADLFAKAVQTVVSGNWRVGRQSGSWSIRAFK